MTTDLFIAVFHGGSVQIICAFQDSILTEHLLDTQHDFLQLLFLFQLRSVREQIDLKDAFIFDHMVGCNRYPSDGQGLVGYLVEQGHSSLNELASKVGRIIQLRTAVCALWHCATIMIDMDGTVVLPAVTVLAVIADIQCQRICNQPLVRKLLTDGQCKMRINGMGFVRSLLDANGLVTGKDYQFSGRYDIEKNAVVISLEVNERVNPISLKESAASGTL